MNPFWLFASVIPDFETIKAFVWEWFGGTERQLALATVLTATGLWKWVPGGTTGRVSRMVAGLVVALGLGWMIAIADPLPLRGTTILVWLTSLIAVISAVLMITESRPFYSAIWFAMVLAGVGGLFLFYGAQFLGIATVAVYAGAIVVTFLFVLMLAQPHGQAYFDRLSWGTWPRWLGCATGIAMTATLLWVSAEITPIASAPASDLAPDGEHVAAFGAQLFSKHLIAVELAGILLTAALVGAVAMATQRTPGQTMNRQLQRAVGFSNLSSKGPSHE
jgi:NADH-quinone oxidoreductase subunit J